MSDHLENSEFLCCTHFQLPSHLPHHSKYDTQMTQILLEEYIFIVRTSVRPSTILIFRIWIRWIFFCRRQEIDNSEEFVRRLRSFRLKRFEFYANFAKLKRRLRSFHLKCFEVYANFAKLSTLMSVKFVLAKHSSQTLRGVR